MPNPTDSGTGGIDHRLVQLERSLRYITEEYVVRMRELSLIKRIADALVYAANQKKVCLDLTDIILDEINAEACQLLIMSGNNDRIVLRAQQYQEDEEGTFFEQDDIVIEDTSGSIIGAILENRNPIYLNDSRIDERYAHDPVISEKSISVLCLPLISTEETIGFIVLDAPEPDAFTEEDKRILQIIANQAATVLKNVQLVNRLQEANREQEDTLMQLSEAEKELSKYTKSLEEMVELRTNELIQSEKMAVIGQLVASVAHELNNPLSIITGYIDMLTEESGLEEQTIGKIKKVQSAARRCAKIVDNLLRLSRKGKILLEHIDINNMIHDTLELYEYQFRINQINVSTQLDPDIPETVGDCQQLQQVFLNLISNARDALQEVNENRHLTVITRRDDNNIICEFRDSGPGIFGKNRKKIFEPFFTTKEAGKGTGLGLSISREIVREHQGDILLDPDYEDGANFMVKIPILKKEIQPKEEKLLEENLITEFTRILLVDEELDIVAFQKDILEKYSCKVDGVNYAHDGLDLALRNDYDIIIMDVNIPGDFDGKNLIEAIQENIPKLRKRILFTTSSSADESTLEYLDSTGNVYIEKPFLIKDYITAINRCLRMG